MLKKCFVILIVIALISTFIGGCKSDDEKEGTTTSKPTQTVEAKAMLRARAAESIVWEGSLLQQKGIDLFGVKIIAENIGISEYEEKYTLAFAADNLPDVFHALGDLSEKQAGDNGARVNFLEYMDIMPNVAAYFSKYPTDVALAASPKGGVYALGRDDDRKKFVFVGITVRTDLLEKGGFYADKIDDWDELKVLELESWDDYNEMLQVLKRENGGQPPRADIELNHMVGQQGQLWGAGIIYYDVWYDNSSIATPTWDFDKEEWVNPWTGERGERMRKYLEWLNWQWDEGLIHPDSLVMDKREAQRLAEQGIVCHNTRHAWESEHFEGGTKDTDMEYAEWRPVLAPPYEGKRYLTNWQMPPGSSVGTGIAIDARSDAKDQLIRWADWLFDPETRMFINDGIENEHFVYCDACDGRDIIDRPYLTLNAGSYEAYIEENGELPELVKPFEELLMDKEQYSAEQLTVPFGQGVHDSLKTWVHMWDMYGFNVGKTEEDLGYSYHAGNAYTEAGYIYPDKIYQPFGALNDEQQEEWEILFGPLDAYITETVAAMIVGRQEISDTYDDFVKRLEELGFDRMIELANIGNDNIVNKVNQLPEEIR